MSLMKSMISFRALFLRIGKRGLVVHCAGDGLVGLHPPSSSPLTFAFYLGFLSTNQYHKPARFCRFSALVEASDSS
jgi:hypothetical protein